MARAAMRAGIGAVGLGLWAVGAGCAGATVGTSDATPPPAPLGRVSADAPLEAAPADQVRRVEAAGVALSRVEMAASRAEADLAIAQFRDAVASLRMEGEVRRVLDYLITLPTLLDTVSLERQKAQAMYYAVHDRLMRVEVQSDLGAGTQRGAMGSGAMAQAALGISSVAREDPQWNAALERLQDPDWRVAVTAGTQLPLHYLVPGKLRDFVEARLRERLADPGDRALPPAEWALPMLFAPRVASDAARNAMDALEAYIVVEGFVPDTLVQRLTHSLVDTDMPIWERVLVLQAMLNSGRAAVVDEAITAMWPKPRGAGIVLRKMGVHPSRAVRAAVALAVPHGSEVLPAARLLPDREAMLEALAVALRDEDLRTRFLAAAAWEGNGGPRLVGYDPRDDAAAREAALATLDLRARPAPAQTTEATTPAAPLAPAAQARALTAEQLVAVERSLKVLGWMHDVWVRPTEMGREPASLSELVNAKLRHRRGAGGQEASFRDHAMGGIRDAANGNLRHAPTGYLFRLAPRPGSQVLTIWADPPADATAAPTLWYDRNTATIKRK